MKRALTLFLLHKFSAKGLQLQFYRTSEFVFLRLPWLLNNFNIKLWNTNSCFWVVTHITCTVGSQEHTLLPDRGQSFPNQQGSAEWLYGLPPTISWCLFSPRKGDSFQSWDSPTGRGTWARCQCPKPWAAGWQGPGYCAASPAPWTWAASQSPPLEREKKTTPVLCCHHRMIAIQV